MTTPIIQPSSPYVTRAEMLTTFERDDAGSVDDIVVLFLGRCPPLIEKIRGALHAGEAAVMYAATQPRQGILRHLPQYIRAWILQEKPRVGELE